MKMCTSCRDRGENSRTIKIDDLKEEWESEMHLNDPRQYLAVRGLNPKTVIECCICPKKFPADEGVAYPVRNGEEPVMGFFCEDLCYLAALPREACWRA
jgi:hypothetical protein